MSVIFGPGIGQPPAQGSLVADTNAADKSPVVVQATDSQAGNLMEFRSPSGTLLSSVDVTGAFGGSAGLNGAVILAPAAAGRNTIQPTLDTVDALTIKGHSATQSMALLIVQPDPTNALAQFIVGSLGGVTVHPTSNAETQIRTFAPASYSVGGVPALAWGLNADAGGNETERLDCGTDGTMTWNAITTVTPTLRGQAKVTPTWKDSTDANHIGQMSLQTRTSGAGFAEGLRVANNGTNPTIGFLGAADVLRQTNGTAADLAAIADAPAKAFITALSTALVNLGLLAAPA